MIVWSLDMAAAPNDGRELLLAVANRLGTAHGGDGGKLHPQYPFVTYIAQWDAHVGRWRTSESDRDGDSEYLEPGEPCAWALINPPFDPQNSPLDALERQ